MNRNRNSLQPGRRLHWYQIREILGQGGFGITYLAEDTNLGRLVAIKEYLPVEMAFRGEDASIQPDSEEHGVQFRRGLERFISEGQTLARFSHPNIVRVHTVFRENNTAYMVMEYERGRGFNEILKERKTLPEHELRAILIPLLSGLEHVHQSGFIHRDVKPANIVIREDGSPVLLDFGSARQPAGQHSRSLTALVSPGFAPYEQYTGRGDNQGPWTDIYGLGGTLYKAATGRAPTDAMDRSEALLRTGRDVFVPAAQIKPDGFSAAFLESIDCALAFRPTDRPATIEAWRSCFEDGSARANADSETLLLVPPREPAAPRPVEDRTVLAPARMNAVSPDPLLMERLQKFAEQGIAALGLPAAIHVQVQYLVLDVRHDPSQGSGTGRYDGPPLTGISGRAG